MKKEACLITNTRILKVFSNFFTFSSALASRKTWYIIAATALFTHGLSFTTFEHLFQQIFWNGNVIRENQINNIFFPFTTHANFKGGLSVKFGKCALPPLRYFETSAGLWTWCTNKSRFDDRERISILERCKQFLFSHIYVWCIVITWIDTVLGNESFFNNINIILAKTQIWTGTQLTKCVWNACIYWDERSLKFNHISTEKEEKWLLTSFWPSIASDCIYCQVIWFQINSTFGYNLFIFIGGNIDILNSTLKKF